MTIVTKVPRGNRNGDSRIVRGGVQAPSIIDNKVPNTPLCFQALNKSSQSFTGLNDYDYICTSYYQTSHKAIMENKQLNRLKVVLAEKNKTNKWLAEQLGRDRATISKWVTNYAQPSLEAMIQIAQCLGVGIEELVRMPEPQKPEE